MSYNCKDLISATTFFPIQYAIIMNDIDEFRWFSLAYSIGHPTITNHFAYIISLIVVQIWWTTYVRNVWYFSFEILTTLQHGTWMWIYQCTSNYWFVKEKKRNKLKTLAFLLMKCFSGNGIWFFLCHYFLFSFVFVCSFVISNRALFI